MITIPIDNGVMVISGLGVLAIAVVIGRRGVGEPAAGRRVGIADCGMQNRWRGRETSPQRGMGGVVGRWRGRETGQNSGMGGVVGRPAKTAEWAAWSGDRPKQRNRWRGRETSPQQSASTVANPPLLLKAGKCVPSLGWRKCAM
jgi:hypothetical protein